MEYCPQDLQAKLNRLLAVAVAECDPEDRLQVYICWFTAHCEKDVEIEWQMKRVGPRSRPGELEARQRRLREHLGPRFDLSRCAMTLDPVVFEARITTLGLRPLPRFPLSLV